MPSVKNGGIWDNISIILLLRKDYNDDKRPNKVDHVVLGETEFIRIN